MEHLLTDKTEALPLDGLNIPGKLVCYLEKFHVRYKSRDLNWIGEAASATL